MMDAAKVAMLIVSTGMVELPPDLRDKADDPAWWKRLEATPDDRLDNEQLRMISALGVDLANCDYDDEKNDDDEPDQLDEV